jgi:NhaA family Na+:H+ antiporter
MTGQKTLGPLAGVARRVLRPIELFLRIEAASGIILLAAAAVAMAAANSPWRGAFEAFWAARIPLSFGAFAFERSVGWWVNDVLMAIFFFVVGMEIRREMHEGELSVWKRAVLPLAAALGGMIAPALLYLGIARGAELRSGWGVPMATDIAFAVGVLALLGPRVPAALRVLLLAVAVIDDLGAIVVIAFFYSEGVKVAGLAVAAIGVASILAQRRLGISAPLAYVPAGAVVWAGIYSANVHPTIAGVIVGMLTPVASTEGQPSVATRLIEKLHPWVAYAIMPIFALANAGVDLSGLAFEGPTALAAVGVGVGLVIGKPLGIVLVSKAAVLSGIGELPRGLGLSHLLVLGVVAGIGFTMALFIAQLAFSDPALLGAAKLGVLTGSAVAGVLGLALGVALLPQPTAA